MSEPGADHQPDGLTPPEATPATLTAGARLRASREERGWTVEQVASQLNLAPRQILAIENDDYPSLPGMAVARGFVRAYAKLLKVDAVPLLAEIGGEPAKAQSSLAPQKTLSTPFSEARLPSMTEGPGVTSKWVLGLLLLVLAGVAIWAARQGSESPAVPAQTVTEVREGVADMAGSGDEAMPPEEKKPAEPAPAAAPGGQEAAAPATQSTAATGQPATVTPDQATAASTSGSSEREKALQLKAREASWVEIRRAGDKSVLLSRIIKEGETVSLDVGEPVTVVIGNASAVDLSLRGAPVELKQNAKNNIARLNLN